MKKKSCMKKAGQVGFEYIVIMGFVTFVIIGLLSVTYFYSNGIKDRLKMIQMENFANKIISSAESVYYAGAPSQVTVKVYLPEEVKEVIIDEVEKILIIEVQLTSGVTTTGFPSEVPISGCISPSSGIKNIKITATQTDTSILDMSTSECD